MINHYQYKVRWMFPGPAALRVGAAAMLLAGLCPRLAAQDAPSSRPAGEGTTQDQDLTSASLEDLMNMEISSVSKKKEKLSDAAAAIYVITNEDLRRMGVRSIPDALRLVPGLDVARIGSSAWAVSARGFNNQFTNKMLVLIDGRTVYTGIFSGVYWDEQDYPLSDIERIEVIRGPGGTLWGANAVNGVINIITKSARDTVGGLIRAGGGTEDLGFGTIRYGGKIGENTFARIYGKYDVYDNSRLVTGGDAPDNWSSGRGGFRLDTNLNEKDSLTVQGDVFRGDLGDFGSHVLLAPPFSTPFALHRVAQGGNLLGRYTHEYSKSSGLQLQMYFDNRDRTDPTLELSENTVDIDFQHRFAASGDHDVLWGLNFRWKDTNVDGHNEIKFDPDHRVTNLAGGFLQDTIAIVEKQVKLTLGSKFEYNDFSGFEIQPSGRVAWEIDERHTLWGAISRAVRTPSPVDFDLRLDLQAFPLGPGVGESVLFGNPRMKSEELIAYELGWRVKPSDRLFFDVAAFVNSYTNIRSTQQAAPFAELTPVPHTVIPVVFRNDVRGTAYGTEVAANFEPAENLHFAASYSFLNIEMRRAVGSNATEDRAIEGTDPENQLHLKSFINISKQVEFDTMLHYVDRLPAWGVRAYTRLDARLGWRPSDRIEFSLGVQNVIDTTHREFGAPTIENPTLIERAVVGSITIRF